MALSIEPACRQNRSQIVEIWSQNWIHTFALRQIVALSCVQLRSENPYINLGRVAVFALGESLTPQPNGGVEQDGGSCGPLC